MVPFVKNNFDNILKIGIATSGVGFMAGILTDIFGARNYPRDDESEVIVIASSILIALSCFLFALSTVMLVKRNVNCFKKNEGEHTPIVETAQKIDRQIAATTLFSKTTVNVAEEDIEIGQFI